MLPLSACLAPLPSSATDFSHHCCCTQLSHLCHLHSWPPFLLHLCQPAIASISCCCPLSTTCCLLSPSPSQSQSLFLVTILIVTLLVALWSSPCNSRLLFLKKQTHKPKHTLPLFISCLSFFVLGFANFVRPLPLTSNSTKSPMSL
ncbi:hypothetical protein AMTRI_Chr11g96450 [Amborella trichopoda]